MLPSLSGPCCLLPPQPAPLVLPLLPPATWQAGRVCFTRYTVSAQQLANAWKLEEGETGGGRGRVGLDARRVMNLGRAGSSVAHGTGTHGWIAAHTHAGASSQTVVVQGSKAVALPDLGSMVQRQEELYMAVPVGVGQNLGVRLGVRAKVAAGSALPAKQLNPRPQGRHRRRWPRHGCRAAGGHCGARPPSCGPPPPASSAARGGCEAPGRRSGPAASLPPAGCRAADGWMEHEDGIREDSMGIEGDVRFAQREVWPPHAASTPAASDKRLEHSCLAACGHAKITP